MRFFQTINLIILLFFFTISKQLLAQTAIETRFSPKANASVVLKLKYATNIQIEYWNESTVLIKSQISINEGENDSNFSLDKEEASDGTITVKSKINNISNITQQKTFIISRENGRRYWTNSSFMDMDNDLEVISGRQLEAKIIHQIYLPANINLKLETIAGNISGQAPRSACILKTAQGSIDLSFKGNENLDLLLKTYNGDIFSDLDLKPNDKTKANLEKVGGKIDWKSTFKLNQGGSQIKLAAYTGNIYLRKE